MGLFGHIRIHESGIDCSLTYPAHPPCLAPPIAPAATCSTTVSTSCTHTMLNPTHTPSSSTLTTSSITSITAADTDTADLSCQHCPRTFTSRIGLVAHLRIHRTETGDTGPRAPNYTRRIRLHCPHCTRAFVHRIGLLGDMRFHKIPRQTTAYCIIPSHPPSSISPHINIADFKHAAAISHASRRYASRLLLYAAPRLHV
ncbi:hypothetical protein SprV_0100142100 [Sparganum proliferum]